MGATLINQVSVFANEGDAMSTIREATLNLQYSKDLYADGDISSKSLERNNASYNYQIKVARAYLDLLDEMAEIEMRYSD